MSNIFFCLLSKLTKMMSVAPYRSLSCESVELMVYITIAEPRPGQMRRTVGKICIHIKHYIKELKMTL